MAERFFKGGGSLKSDVTFKGGGLQKVTIGDKGGVKNLKIKVTSFMDGPYTSFIRFGSKRAEKEWSCTYM